MPSSRPSGNVRRLWLVTSLALTTGCRCGEKPAEPAARFVGKDADLVVEIPDLGAGVARRPDILRLLDGVASKAEIDEVLATAQRVLGFDPTTKDGLATAGLPEHGSAAIELVNGGRTMLWILPVKDQEKAKKTLDALIRARVQVDKTAEDKAGTVPLVVCSTTFGDQQVPVAAYGFAQGLLFVGVGEGGAERIKTALARRPEDSVTIHPEYVALSKAIGDRPMFRLISPSAGELGRRFAAGGPTWVADALLSTGWAFDLDARGASIDAWFRLNDAAKAKVKKIFSPKAKPSPALLSALASEGVLFGQLAIDQDAWLAELVPEGSPDATDLEAGLVQFKEATGLDLKKQLLPELTGQVVAAFGIADLSSLAGGLEALARSPSDAIWTAIGIGIREAKTIEKLPPLSADSTQMLAARGLTKSTRKVGDQEVTIITPASAGDGGQGSKVETFVRDGAWLASNSAPVVDGMLGKAAAAASDPLGGAGGLWLELRFAALVKAARSVDTDKLGAESILVKAMVGKALSVLSRLDRLTVSLLPEAAGLHGKATLAFAAAGQAANQ